MATTQTDSDFARFVDEHEHLLRRFVAQRMLDTPADIEDGLQEGLVRIWREFPDWPADPALRLKYARRTLTQMAHNTLRAKWGEGLYRREREIYIDFGDVERTDQEHRDGVVFELMQLLSRMQQKLDDDYTNTAEFERRWAAFNAMIPALKDMERAVLLATHPAGESLTPAEVAEKLGITYLQAKQHYMEARAVLAPLMAHALAPELDPAEAQRVMDYTAGVMTDKRERGRMKRHLKHCEQCRRLAEGERVVVSAGAAVFLPLPALVGLWKATSATAAVGAGTAAVAASTSAGGGALAGGVLAPLASKAAAGIAALVIAAGGSYAAIEVAGQDGAVARARAASPATATPETASVAATPAPVVAAVTATPVPAKRAKAERGRDDHKRRREDKRSGRSDRSAATEPAPAPTVAATTVAPSTPPASEPAPSAPSTSGASAPAEPQSDTSGSTPAALPEPPADTANDSFSQEFAP